MSIEFCSNEVLDALLAVSPEYRVADYRGMKSESGCHILTLNHKIGGGGCFH